LRSCARAKAFVTGGSLEPDKELTGLEKSEGIKNTGTRGGDSKHKIFLKKLPGKERGNGKGNIL